MASDGEFEWDDVIAFVDEPWRWRIYGIDQDFYYIENISRESPEYGMTHCLDREKVEANAVKVGRWDLRTRKEAVGE